MDLLTRAWSVYLVIEHSTNKSSIKNVNKILGRNFFLEHLAIKSGIIDQNKKKLSNNLAYSFSQAIFTSYQRLKKGFMSLNLMELAKLCLPNISNIY